MADPIERFEHHAHRMVAEGDSVIFEHTEIWHFHTGEVMRNPFVTVHEVRGGKIGTCGRKARIEAHQP